MLVKSAACRTAKSRSALIALLLLLLLLLGWLEAAPLPLTAPFVLPLLLLLAWLCTAWLGQACTAHSHDMLPGFV
jgi:hypothetical protein